MPRTSSARERLVDSAARLVHTRSYAATSVEDLCLAAGVQKGSFYHFFSTKHELVLAAIDRQWATARAEILEPAFDLELDPPQRFVRFFQLAADRQRGGMVRGCPFGNLAAEVGTLEASIRARVAEVFSGYLGYFEAALQDAVEAGLLDFDDVKPTAALVLASFQGALLLAKTRNDPSLIEQVGDQIVRVLAVHPSDTARTRRPTRTRRRPNST
jgi:TetR/AcrR family transcriptional repressor of nem operon